MQILDGLEMLWDKGFRKVLIECDSEVALELVSIGVDDNHPCSALLSHTLSEGINVFDFPHVDLGSILVADLNDPLVPRLCVS
ncbi:putative ribonuclease H protein [Senna tora]|uniref:Putative ribonuclease H protein n=1 Tax=Senna tora TaxID=362788 RepID=A0A834SQL3_9FABA|nr:putative ribonuclease H protein [Senna tora]